jgi:hypothetical protein
MTPSANGAALQKILTCMLEDLTALASAVNQLIADYNANTIIATPTTAGVVELQTME